jgi:hypothetical protein
VGDSLGFPQQPTLVAPGLVSGFATLEEDLKYLK